MAKEKKTQAAPQPLPSLPRKSNGRPLKRDHLTLNIFSPFYQRDCSSNMTKIHFNH